LERKLPATLKKLPGNDRRSRYRKGSQPSILILLNCRSLFCAEQWITGKIENRDECAAFRGHKVGESRAPRKNLLTNIDKLPGGESKIAGQNPDP
jgi:hypothetical protein